MVNEKGELICVGELEDNTLVVYTSDQGFYLGEHGWFDKRFMYEESLRMPFIIRYPEKIKPKTVIADVISNIDLAPTVLDMVGVDIPKEVQGKSFFKQLSGIPNNEWRQSMYYHYYEYPNIHNVPPHEGIRTARYKLINFYKSAAGLDVKDLRRKQQGDFAVERAGGPRGRADAHVEDAVAVERDRADERPPPGRKRALGIEHPGGNGVVEPGRIDNNQAGVQAAVHQPAVGDVQTATGGAKGTRSLERMNKGTGNAKAG